MLYLIIFYILYVILYVRETFPDLSVRLALNELRQNHFLHLANTCALRTRTGNNIIHILENLCYFLLELKLLFLFIYLKKKFKNSERG